LWDWVKNTMKKDERNKVVREKLKKSLLFRMVAINPNSSSTINSPNISSFIDSRLQQIFKSFNTPTHAPYALVSNSHNFFLLIFFISYKLRYAIFCCIKWSLVFISLNAPTFLYQRKHHLSLSFSSLLIQTLPLTM
jgi:hypothetical protein